MPTLIQFNLEHRVLVSVHGCGRSCRAPVCDAGWGRLPTDNLDLASADALETAITQFPRTVIMVTHDRWLMRSCDRFLIFGRDCTVNESDEPKYR